MSYKKWRWQIISVLVAAAMPMVGMAQMDPRGAIIRVQPEVNFGQVAIGTTAAHEYVFTNLTGERATINTVGFDDFVTVHTQDPPHPARAVFAVTGLALPTTLGPGGQFRFTIRFTPPAAQAYRPGNSLTLCVTTEVTRQHIHYQIPLVGQGVVGPGAVTSTPAIMVYGLIHVPNRGVVTIFEVPSGKVAAEVSLGAIASEGAWPIAVTPDGQHGLLNVPSRGAVLIFEIPSGKIAAEVKLGFLMTGPSPIIVTPDGQHGLVYMFNRGTVVIFTVPAGTVVAEVGLQAVMTGLPIHQVLLHRLLTGPSPIVLTPDGRHGLVHVASRGVVTIFELPSGKVVREVFLQALMAEPSPIVVTPDGRHALVHVPNRGVITIFEVPSGRVTAEVDLRAVMFVPSPITLVERP